MQQIARLEQLSHTFAALADPTRLAILAHLANGKTTVGELSKPFESQMSKPAITKHLKVLEKAGLISRSREAQTRPCELESAPLKEVSDWVEQYKAMWECSFDRLDAYLQTLKRQKKEKRNEKKRRQRVR